MKKFLLWVLACCLTPLAYGADRLDTAVWVKRPIPLVLPVGEGITVFLPEGDWAAGIPSSVVPNLTRYPVNNTVYLQANESFEPVLMQLKNIDSEDVISVLLSASDNAPVVDLKIIDGTKVDTSEGLKGKKSDVLKALTRHAALSLYAPDRLIPHDRFIKPFPIDKATLKVFVRVLGSGSSGCTDTGQLVGAPIASWRSGGKAYVTAIRIENVSKEVITIDPRGCHIKGEFLTATPQHSSLMPKYEAGCVENRGSNDTADSKGSCKRTYKEVTTLYLTSARPFWEVVSDENK